MRPLGIPATEDKLLQLAVKRLLEAIYEQDFLPCSYGYRPRVGALEAVDQLTVKLQFGGYHQVVEADIKGFFDNLSHEWLMRMLAERIDDQAILRLIKKWLKAGVLDTDGKVLRPEGGTPQGGIISPLLANVYLHYALDLWFEKVFQRVVEAQRSCIDTQMILCAASGGKKRRNAFTVSWENVCGSSDWNWRQTRRG